MEQRAALPEGADVVVRALPPAGAADYSALSGDFRSALRSAARRAGLDVETSDVRGAR